jgi:REP element-mobilizing transposase RayT
MKYNPEIHHRRSIRLKGYDYSQEGLYFITICTHNRKCLFGEITDGKMILNEIGKIVENEWIKSAEIRAEIEIHAYCIMPNHFHAIAEIVAVDTYNDGTTVGANGIRPYYIRPYIRPYDRKGVCHTPLRSPSKTIGALVRGFKSAVTKQIGFNVWQRNYFENIIRDWKSYQTITEYIINNPAKWENDKFYGNDK